MLQIAKAAIGDIGLPAQARRSQAAFQPQIHIGNATHTLCPGGKQRLRKAAQINLAGDAAG